MRPFVRHPSILQTKSFTSFNGSLPKYPKLDKEIIFLGWKFLHTPNPNISNTIVIFRQNNQLWNSFFLMSLLIFFTNYILPLQRKNQNDPKRQLLCSPFKKQDEIYFLSIRDYVLLHLSGAKPKWSEGWKRHRKHIPFPPIISLEAYSVAAKKRQLARCNQLMPSTWTLSVMCISKCGPDHGSLGQLSWKSQRWC